MNRKSLMMNFWMNRKSLMTNFLKEYNYPRMNLNNFAKAMNSFHLKNVTEPVNCFAVELNKYSNVMVASKSCS
jgi:hypothetical protein